MSRLRLKLERRVYSDLASIGRDDPSRCLKSGFEIVAEEGSEGYKGENATHRQKTLMKLNFLMETVPFK
jgi:hypothetical protein